MTQPRITEHTGASPADMASHIADVLRDAIATRGQASLAVSGGKSPVPVFEALREQTLDWSRTSIILVDERIVPRDHDASNTGLVVRHLLTGPAARARFLPFFGEVPAQYNADVLDALIEDATNRLCDLPWPLDVAVLGMGEDGHTASLFAGAAGYARAIATDERLAWVVPDTAPHARISLTLHALLSARELVLSLAGPTKTAVLHRARTTADPALPVSLVLNQTRTPVSIWIG
ncbi:MAG: 6-phosphogluconolactonase [Burkholderiaceae bacterium]